MANTMLKNLNLPLIRRVRQFSTKKKVKPIVKMDEETSKMIDNDELKPRKHAGRLLPGVVEFPLWLQEAVKLAVEDMPKLRLIADGKKMIDFLKGRHPPVEPAIIESKYNVIRKKLASARDPDAIEGKSTDQLDAEEREKSMKMVQKSLHRWSPVDYDSRYASLLYLVSRTPHEYAVLHKIFHEISSRDENFRPESLMDFGSGVGCVSWVANHLWPKTIKEHLCIDISENMFNLAELLIDRAEPKINNVFHRQYIPFAKTTYDLVVSAYTLMELPHMESRFETVSKLWAKTKKYLVLVEHGTNAGFKVINEARDLIIHINESQNEKNERANRIFAPCPHKFKCPRYRQHDTPCNFEASYYPFKLVKPLKMLTERFCYVVFQKGEFDDKTQNWPRLVRPTLERSKHVICRMCDANGELTEIIFTSTKHGKPMYRCAKVSQWGDRLPLETEIPISNEEEEIGNKVTGEGEEMEEISEKYEEEDQEAASKETVEETTIETNHQTK